LSDLKAERLGKLKGAQSKVESAEQMDLFGRVHPNAVVRRFAG